MKREYIKELAKDIIKDWKYYSIAALFAICTMGILAFVIFFVFLFAISLI